ncbi:MAG: RNA 2',3'-cyclic phosphodiesterase [Archangium sp.]|nr:RNA 2',3'-cyclic phosphodiesterase [Archangium sp.]
MSVFLAVDLDDPTRALATGLIETHRGMAASAQKVKWLRPDKLHCTLVFLGNPSADQVAAWVPVVDEVARRLSPFSLRLRGAGCFSTARAPSVLWLGVEGELERLLSLQLALTAPLTPTLSPLRREREYLPHVTLARAQGHGFFDLLSAQLKDFVSPDFGVAHVSLYESSSEVYRVLHRAPLGEPSP